MWSDILIGYSIFILEILTILLVIAAIFAIILTMRHKNQARHGELQIIDLVKVYENNAKKLKDFYLTEQALKQTLKLDKKEAKQKAKEEKQKYKKGLPVVADETKDCVYVINFNGDIQASETSKLREEINAILAVAKPDKDQVLVRLESVGGLVHSYGLAASQLARLKDKGIKLTITVDKVAASGGYMMACVADKIVSAPFAVIGSVGVVAQIPNIHRLLKKNDIDVELMTAGEYKRTMTVLGENTEQGKQKFQQELNETHLLFKQFITQNRPNLDIEKVSTGEHWFGQQALRLGLVDQIATSDDIILDLIKENAVLEVKYVTRKSLLQKVGKQAENSVNNLLSRWLKNTDKTFF